MRPAPRTWRPRRPPDSRAAKPEIDNDARLCRRPGAGTATAVGAARARPAPTFPAELFRPEVDPVRRTYDAYEEVVEAFRALIESVDREAPLQEFLREHPALLTLEAAQVYPRFQLANDYVAASRPLYTRDGNPSAEFTHAIQQVEDWRTWITTASEYIRQLLPGIVEPECWVVIGRRPDDDRSQKKWARKQRTLSRIKLFTYDDLLAKAMRQLNTLQRYQTIEAAGSGRSCVAMTSSRSILR